MDKQLKLNALSLSAYVQKILADVTIDLPNPGVTVLLGANGAGKSSLLNVMAGIISPSSGEFNQHDIRTVAYMPEPASFYAHLTVREQLGFIAHLYAASEASVDQVIELWQLSDQENKLTKHLSLGYRQRLSLAQLSLADADLLLLDEPMNGMDPEVMAVFKQQVSHWRENKAVVMATHVMHEAAQLTDWVVVMQRGEVVYSAPYQNENMNELYQQAIDSHHNTKSKEGSTLVN